MSENDPCNPAVRMMKVIPYMHCTASPSEVLHA
ncbi:hypothetical protein BH10PSE18_BH10PSE18_13270 [soil metagenome]